MRPLQRDRKVEPAQTAQARRLRADISRYRRRLLEITHPETAQVFEMLLTGAQARLDEIEDDGSPISRASALCAGEGE